MLLFDDRFTGTLRLKYIPTFNIVNACLNVISVNVKIIYGKTRDLPINIFKSDKNTQTLNVIMPNEVRIHWEVWGCIKKQTYFNTYSGERDIMYL